MIGKIKSEIPIQTFIKDNLESLCFIFSNFSQSISLNFALTLTL
jgi:hypothetical protein